MQKKEAAQRALDEQIALLQEELAVADSALGNAQVAAAQAHANVRAAAVFFLAALTALQRGVRSFYFLEEVFLARCSVRIEGFTTAARDY